MSPKPAQVPEAVLDKFIDQEITQERTRPSNLALKNRQHVTISNRAERPDRPGLGCDAARRSGRREPRVEACRDRLLTLQGSIGRQEDPGCMGCQARRRRNPNNRRRHGEVGRRGPFRVCCRR